MFPLQQWVRGLSDFLQGTPHYVSSTASPPQQDLPRDGYESDDDGPTITSCVGGRGAPSSRAQTAVAEREPQLSSNTVAERQPLLPTSSNSVRRPEPQPEPPALQSLLESQLDRVTYFGPLSAPPPPPSRPPPTVEWSPAVAPTSVRIGAVELSQNLTSPFVLSESDIRPEPSAHIRSSGEDWPALASRLQSEAVVAEQQHSSDEILTPTHLYTSTPESTLSDATSQSPALGPPGLVNTHGSHYGTTANDMAGWLAPAPPDPPVDGPSHHWEGELSQTTLQPPQPWHFHPTGDPNRNRYGTMPDSTQVHRLHQQFFTTPNWSSEAPPRVSDNQRFQEWNRQAADERKAAVGSAHAGQTSSDGGAAAPRHGLSEP